MSNFQQGHFDNQNPGINQNRNMGFSNSQNPRFQPRGNTALSQRSPNKFAAMGATNNSAIPPQNQFQNSQRSVNPAAPSKQGSRFGFPSKNSQIAKNSQFQQQQPQMLASQAPDQYSDHQNNVQPHFHHSQNPQLHQQMQDQAQFQQHQNQNQQQQLQNSHHVNFQSQLQQPQANVNSSKIPARNFRSNLQPGSNTAQALQSLASPSNNLQQSRNKFKQQKQPFQQNNFAQQNNYQDAYQQDDPQQDQYQINYQNMYPQHQNQDVSDLNLTVYTNDSFLDQSQDFEQNSSNILAFNRCLIDAYQQFGSQNIPQLISTFQKALQVAKDLKCAQQKENILLIKTNLGIAYYYNNETSLAAETLQDALMFYQNYQQHQASNLNKSAVSQRSKKMKNSPQMDSIYLKILCNLLIVSLSLNKLEEVQEIANELLSFIQQSESSQRQLLKTQSRAQNQNQNHIAEQEQNKLNLLQEAIYILFRVPSLGQINEEYIESIKSGLQGANLGCFLIIIALSRELQGELVQALSLYEEAFEHFCQDNDCLFMLLSLRHILRIYADNDPENPDCFQYQSQYEILLQDENLRNLNLSVLFENFDQRVEAAKQLAEGLSSLETLQEQQMQALAQQGDKPQRNFMDTLQEENRELWKRSIRYNLSHSIKGTDELLKNRELSQVQYQQLLQSKEQLQFGLQLFEKETNPVILQKLISDKYSRESLRLVRASCERIREKVKKLARIEFFDMLRPHYDQYVKQKNKYSRKSLSQLRREKEDQEMQMSNKDYVKGLNIKPIIMKALGVVRTGDNLYKLNFNSSGGHMQYFRVMNDSLRWTGKEANIDSKKLKGVKVFKFADINAITFGFQNKTFLKNKKNRALEPFLCFTIWTKKRPFDIYCFDDEKRLQFDFGAQKATQMSSMNAWFIGLSYLVKLYNPEAQVMSSGEFLWEKSRAIMFYLVNMAMGEKHKISDTISYVKLVNWYKLVEQFEEQQNQVKTKKK